jgi:uncharacterized protein YggE
MSRSISIYLFVISAGLAFAQLDSNSITVTASRTSTIQPDQAVFSVVVSSDLNSSLTDVLSALQPAGLTLANFSGVTTNGFYYSTANPFPQQLLSLQWTFQLVAPLASTKSTVATLTSLQSSVPKMNKNLGASFSLQGTQVSPQAQQSQTCDLAGLITDAQAKAQTLATAGARTLAGLLSLSSSTTTPGSTASGVTSSFPPLTCSVTAKFGLLGN